MKNHGKNQKVFLIACLFPFFSMAQEQQQPEWQIQDSSGLILKVFKNKVKSQAPKFPSDITVSEILESSGQTWFPWNPSGLNSFPASKECRQESLRDLIAENSSVPAQGKAINHWLSRCQNEISNPFSKRSIGPLLKFATVQYDFAANKNIYHAEATLPDGRFLTGFVAMKLDGKPRPFVITKCGVLCNAQNSTTHRSFMMHLFDESPFHVLALANNTGTDFEINNKALSVGGFDEGRQLYQIAQLLRSPASPVRDLISSVHVVGASLGGSAALYAGLYASANDLPGQESIQSVTAVCPVVVLEKSMKRLYHVKPISTVASFGTLRHISDIISFVPILNKVLPPDFDRLRGDKLYRNLTKAIFMYYRDWTAKTPWDLKPFAGVQVGSLEQFWQLNDFQNYLNQVRVPTLTIAAENDDLVKVEDNTKLLTRKLRNSPNDAIATVYFKQGNHCAFSMANGWGNYSTLLREYILSHSPEASQHWRSQKVEWPARHLKLEKSEQIVETKWEARSGQADLKLKLKVFRPGIGLADGEECEAHKALRSLPGCYREIRTLLPIKSLPLAVTEIPVSEYEVTAMTRLANTRLSVLDARGELVVNSNRSPRSIEGWLWQ